MSSWAGQPSVKGSSETVRMMLLTFSSVGMTFTWGIEMTYCTPYLLSLGLTKGQTSVVWIAGPLSGLVVQPVIGVISDQSKSKWGRRRPIIMAATLIVVCSLLCLGFTKEIVSFFIADKQSAKVPTIALAVLALYATDFAINAVMSCSRSLVVDTLPAQKQQAGAAWASRMSSVGHITGYGMGAIDLVSLLGPTLGDTQFKQLTVIAALGMLASSSITCWAVSERILISVKPDSRRSHGRFKVFSQIWSTLLTLPPRIQAICWAVFWSWIGWFPFLIYSSTWVGETYFRYDVPEDAKNSSDALGDMGRIGSMALTVYSLVTFLSAWILPLFIKAPDDESFTHRPPASIAPWIEKLNKIKPDLLTAWFCSHLVYSAAMSLAPFAASFRFATVLVAICGLPWTIAMWAPTTFLGVEVNKLSGEPASGSYRRLSVSSNIEMTDRAAAATAAQRHASSSSAAESSSSPANTGELSGVYFGILNIYTTLPQFIGTFMSTVIFAVLEPGKSPELATDANPSEHHGTDGPNAIAVCLFIGALSTLGAAYATQRLRYIP
ncbi:Sucrose transporter [Coniochaeta hoffmannii]|uniref:Sucrose transporter n=1 Tax=Coniochaeta hoffmannii TaxID=91930 RepID=A0AA38RXU1_9PEZI|nr:Sucrose transporter [Coniochaeta hoffmannii]